jgi:hypothetical protein
MTSEQQQVCYVADTNQRSGKPQTDTPPLGVIKHPLFLVFYKNKNLLCNTDQTGGGATGSGEGHAGGSTAGTTGIFIADRITFLL